MITRDVWDKGERATGNSLRKALLSYAWDKQEKPVKDGREDPLDALRYDCILYNWNDTSIQSGYKSRSTSSNRSRKVRTGGASAKDF